MTELGSLDPMVIRAIKKVFKLLIQSSFWHRFSFGCPSYISAVRSLSFLPHVLGLVGGWRHVQINVLCHALQLSPQELDDIIDSPSSVRGRFPHGHPLADAIVEHRTTAHQSLPTRLRHLSCWNLNSWRFPAQPSDDGKMRKVKRLLRKGPVLLRETKWCGGQEEILSQQLPGVTICSTAPLSTELGNPSGGTSVLIPAGWQYLGRTVLVPGKAVAALLADRGCQFYIVSVYLHPERVREDLRDFVRAWTQFDKLTSRAIICGDFNRADRVDREGWDLLLSHASACDVAPDLVTYVSTQTDSNLDRCLISEDWVSSAQWNPVLRATYTSNFGHKIMQMQLKVRPTVLNNPRHPKHETVPASVFMPGKDGTSAQEGTEALQGLIRLLHRMRERFLRVQSVGLFTSLSGASASVPRNAGEELSSSQGHLVLEIALRRYFEARSIGKDAVDNPNCYADAFNEAHLYFSSCFWAWWKSQPNPKHHPAIAPALSCP